MHALELRSHEKPTSVVGVEREKSVHEACRKLLNDHARFQFYMGLHGLVYEASISVIHPTPTNKSTTASW